MTEVAFYKAVIFAEASSIKENRLSIDRFISSISD